MTLILFRRTPGRHGLSAHFPDRAGTLWYRNLILTYFSSNPVPGFCTIFCAHGSRTLREAIIGQHTTKHVGSQCLCLWWFFLKLVALTTSTMVLKLLWRDIEWAEHDNNHPLSRFHGPGGWWHRRGDTSKEPLFSCWAWYMGYTTTTIRFQSLWINIYA
jgi:hypothetical protein